MPRLKNHTGARRKTVQRVREAPEVVAEISEAHEPRGGATVGELHRSARRLDHSHAMILAPLDERIAEQYQMFHKIRGVPVEGPFGAGAFVVDETGLLLAGMPVYQTSGPWLIIGHVATNPTVGLKIRHRAVVLCCMSVAGYCSMVNKAPLLLFPDQKPTMGLRMIARRMGAAEIPGVMAIGLKLTRLQ